MSLGQAHKLLGNLTLPVTGACLYSSVRLHSFTGIGVGGIESNAKLMHSKRPQGTVSETLGQVQMWTPKRAKDTF